MKTLQEVKDDVARKCQCYSWEELCQLSSKETILYYSDLATLRFAKEVAKQTQINCVENAVMCNKFGNDIGKCCFDANGVKIFINRQSILDFKNIPNI